ncbi:MAG: stage II sporulation protein R [Firmicutes bacterium]|nr:stage II sporulation protein R [Bacillota bacterium]
MKARIITVLILFLIGGVVLSLTGSSQWPAAEATVAFSAGNLIRLHVMANSDGEADQQVKLLVRDRILKETAVLLAGVDDRAAALAALRRNQATLVAAAEEELHKHGFSYRATVEVGEFRFPERHYEFGVLPAGNYQALRVVLGNGQGRNWWCVLFPPVCHLTMAEEKPAGERERIRLRWKALEELERNKEQLAKKAWVEWAKWFQLATIIIK